jgi:hypothetical protein
MSNADAQYQHRVTFKDAETKTMLKVGTVGKLPGSTEFKPAASIAKVLALAFALSVSTSCSQDNRQAVIKECIADVQRDASTGSIIDLLPSDNGEIRHDKMGAAVVACMSKAGYSHANFDMTDQRCVDDVDFNPYCYRKGQ